MDPHLQTSRVDPRKQALLEGRLSGRAKVSPNWVQRSILDLTQFLTFLGLWVGMSSR